MSVPKYVINLKRIITQQQPKFFAIVFYKINPDAHVSTKINTLTFYKGGLGATTPTSQRNYKKMEAILFSSYITYQARR